MIEVEPNRVINACVIYPVIYNGGVVLSEDSRLEEACGLARAINLNVVHAESVRVKEVKPSMYFSRGFTERIAAEIAAKAIELMVVDTKLTPIQQRNLERELKIKVIDRTALILEIFGERAQTKEGALQVELAHLTYQRSRLVRSWTHLERQRGGAGFLGGPGETQIELDRRVIDDKIVRIKKELEKVKKTRGIQRGARQKVPYPVAALVGYTNAGKSTLFNYLTDSHVMAADMLFATLDPTMRKTVLPSGTEIILSDTVGFISDLPHELVMAFRATLEEVLNADVILHIRDISNPDTAAQRTDVLQVLQHLGLKEVQHADNYIEVWNKADLLPSEEYEQLKNKSAHSEHCVLLSAVSGVGCSQLLQMIDDKLAAGLIRAEINIPADDGKTAAWLHRNAQVSHLENAETQNIYTVRISPQNFARIAQTADENQSIRIRKI
ncbi:MAG: GTPase HflX [Alphaproteobacteria bacterium]|nr:GTPase HflX [Alphaproteobacteria bacterium]